MGFCVLILEQDQRLVGYHTQELVGFCGQTLRQAQRSVGFYALGLVGFSVLALVFGLGSSQDQDLFPWPFSPAYL